MTQPTAPRPRGPKPKRVGAPTLAALALDDLRPLPRPEDKAQAGRLFQGVRKGLGLTVAELAPLLRVQPAVIYGWEQGRFAVDPSAWLLLQVLVKYPAAWKWAAMGSEAKEGDG
jgi:hypothetical protein